jgi:hypothetical protein
MGAQGLVEAYVHSNKERIWAHEAHENFGGTRAVVSHTFGRSGPDWHYRRGALQHSFLSRHFVPAAPELGEGGCLVDIQFFTKMSS